LRRKLQIRDLINANVTVRMQMGENYVKNQEPESEGSELKEAKTNRGKREVNQHVKEREV